VREYDSNVLAPEEVLADPAPKKFIIVTAGYAY
jgi:hypothetical protein